jgi:hypothetical protein
MAGTSCLTLGCGNASATLLALRGTTFRYSEFFQGVNRSYWASPGR